MVVPGAICPLMSSGTFLGTNVRERASSRDALRTALPVIQCRSDCALFISDEGHPRGGQCALLALARAVAGVVRAAGPAPTCTPSHPRRRSKGRGHA